MKDRVYLLEKMYGGWQLPGSCLAGDGTVLCGCAGPGQQPDPDMALQIRERCEGLQYPVMCFESGRIFYMGFTDDEGVTYLLGPACEGTPDEKDVLAFRHRHAGYTGEIPSIYIERAVSCLLVLYAAVTGNIISESEVMKASDVYAWDAQTGGYDGSTLIWQLDLFSKDISYHTYESEKAFLDEFRLGQMQIPDYVVFSDMWQLEGTGPLAKDDFTKASEYSVVSAAVLMRAAAIDEGVPADTAYRIVNGLLQQMPKAENAVEFMSIYQQLVGQLSAEIRKAHERPPEDDIISHCKDYIAKHIKTQFTIQEMADDMGYNMSYLSRIFSETEGQTLKQYITSERLRLTANLLRYSDEKIGTISDYMGFSSQKRMSEQFAKEYGMTPSEYRRLKRVR